MQGLSPAELEQLANLVANQLADRVIDRFAERLQLPIGNEPRLVDAYRLSDAVGLSVPTIHRAVKAGTLPSIQAGTRRLYSIPEVIEAMREAGPELTKGETTRAQQA